MVPTAIIGNNEYFGTLKGYYVPETQYYNIVPIDANIDNNRILDLGVILHTNPFKEARVENIIDNGDYTKADRKGAQALLQRASRNDISPEAWADLCLKIRSAAPGIDPCDCLIGYRDNGELHLVQCFCATDCLPLITRVKIESYSLKLDLFSRNTGILESDIMLHKRAMFIGCGSVGSLVAVELAKAGVGNFMLVDNDIFGYHNICRHQCGIYDVGRYKTDALAERILQINPYAQIEKFNLAIQDVDRDAFMKFCNEDTIIVGGADNREGDLYACNLGIKAGAAFVSIGCWERAFAGEIFYCLPSGTPTYRDFLEVTGYVSGRVTQNRRFYTSEEDLEKVSFEPGISADVNFVTIVGVKLILDLLNRDNDNYTQRLLPHLTQYTLVCNTNSTAIGGEQAEIFSYPLQVTTSIEVPYATEQ